jgi:hypothetical protein
MSEEIPEKAKKPPLEGKTAFPLEKVSYVGRKEKSNEYSGKEKEKNR